MKMDFNLTEDAVMVKDSAAKYLKDNCPGSAVREMIESEDGYSKNIWKEVGDLGWLGYIYNEKYGGIEGSFFDLCMIFEEMGRFRLPSPFFTSCVLSGLLINEAGSDAMKDAFLPGITSGEKILTTALLDEEGNYDFGNPALKAKEIKGSKYAINGTMILVPYAHIADGIVVCADVDGRGATLFIIEKQSSGIQIIPLDTMSGEKKAAVIFKDVVVDKEHVIGAVGEGTAYIDKVLIPALVLKSIEMLGGLEKVCDMTVAYMKEREQFGGPLGRLQVVQHYCADMATYLQTSKMMAYQAAYMVDKGLPCAKEAYMAKALLSDSYKKVTWIAHQLHGGIGFTEEHDLHLYHRHAKEAELELGGASVYREKIADAMGL